MLGVAVGRDRETVPTTGSSTAQVLATWVVLALTHSI